MVLVVVVAFLQVLVLCITLYLHMYAFALRSFVLPFLLIFACGRNKIQSGKIIDCPNLLEHSLQSFYLMSLVMFYFTILFYFFYV